MSTRRSKDVNHIWPVVLMMYKRPWSYVIVFFWQHLKKMSDFSESRSNYTCMSLMCLDDKHFPFRWFVWTLFKDILNISLLTIINSLLFNVLIFLHSAVLFIKGAESKLNKTNNPFSMQTVPVYLIKILDAFRKRKGLVWDLIMPQINTTKGLSAMHIGGHREVFPEDEAAR